LPIAIICSGGDCAGMNPAIKKFVDYAYEKKIQPYFIYDGLEGLIDNSIEPAIYEDVSGIIHDGGTMIRSSRSKRFFKHKYRKQAYENLKNNDIDKVIVLGGDGSFRAFEQFYKDFKIDFVGIPSTIDNDIFGTDYCLGVDTALNIIRKSIDEVRDTSASFKRACVVETMGRDCGYLALVSAITSGAEICIIPELEYDLNSLGKKLKKQLKNGRRYIVAVVAEGSKRTKMVVKWLENEIKIETRATILGHIQRGGNPTVFDRMMATEFVKNAMDKLITGQDIDLVVVYKNSKFDFVSIDYINSQKYMIKDSLLEMAENLAK